MVSLLIGSWLHVAWDQFTNDERWLATRWDFLHWPVARLGPMQIEVCRLLWIISTVGGSLALGFAYAHFLRRHRPSGPPSRPAEMKRSRLWSAIFSLPILIAVPLTLHLQGTQGPGAGFAGYAHRFAGLYVAAFCGCVLLLALFAKVKPWGAGNRTEGAGSSNGRQI
jgi:hypothetical protein